MNEYADTFAWSKALNEELGKILGEMTAKELSYLLEHTQGMFRTVIKQYLDEAQKRESRHGDDLVATVAL